MLSAKPRGSMRPCKALWTDLFIQTRGRIEKLIPMRTYQRTYRKSFVSHSHNGIVKTGAAATSLSGDWVKWDLLFGPYLISGKLESHLPLDSWADFMMFSNLGSVSRATRNQSISHEIIRKRKERAEIKNNYFIYFFAKGKVVHIQDIS